MADRADPDSDRPAEPPRLPAQDESEAADADALVADIAAPALGRTLAISLGVHLVVILLTSINFIYLCFKHHTLHPRPAIQAIEKAEREEKLEAEREAARERILAKHGKKKADEQPPSAKEGEQEPGGDAKKPKILKELEATSGERPTKSDVRLNELDMD